MRRTHPEEVLAGHHERTQIQALLGSSGNPAGIQSRQLPDAGDEVLGGQRRQREPMCRILETLGVGLGPEQPHRPVRVPVGLEALEDLLRIVIDSAGRLHGDLGVVGQAVIVPALLHGPAGHAHVIGEVLAESRIVPDSLDHVIAQEARIIRKIE